jgi:hypothetical protein
LDDTVGLFYCGVPLPEAELVSGRSNNSRNHEPSNGVS